MRRLLTSITTAMSVFALVCGQTTLKGLHTSEDISYVRQQLDTQSSPWTDAFSRLETSKYASTSYTASPVEWLARLNSSVWGELNDRWTAAGIEDLYVEGICNNYTYLMRDAAAAYQLALRYVLTDDEQYADAAKSILTAWTNTNKGLLRNSAGELIDPNEYLILIQAHQLAVAAELLRNSDNWDTTDEFASVCQWLKDTFYVPASDFLKHHNNTTDHYWLNWDLAAMTSVLSVGIVCDDETMQAEAIEYFKHGDGVGCITNAVPYLHDDPSGTGETLGQCNESGRDQGHATLCAALLGAFCQMAKGVGEDLFAYDDYRAIAMAEYIAKYNITEGDDFKYPAETIPFTSYTYGDQGQMDSLSADSRGTQRPGWDIWVGYCNANERACKYSDEIAALDRPDAGGGTYGSNSGGFDQLGFSTLMFYRAPLGSTTLVSNILSHNETEAEYYTIQGIKVSNPTSGLFIVKRGNTFTKVIL